MSKKCTLVVFKTAFNQDKLQHLPTGLWMRIRTQFPPPPPDPGDPGGKNEGTEKNVWKINSIKNVSRNQIVGVDVGSITVNSSQVFFLKSARSILTLDPYAHKMNADPQPWVQSHLSRYLINLCHSCTWVLAWPGLWDPQSWI